MPIKLTCPTCTAQMNAPDAAAGKRVKCPKCQKVLVVPELVIEAPAFEVVEDEPTLPVKKPAPRPAARPQVNTDVVIDEDEEDERPIRQRRLRGEEERSKKGTNKRLLVVFGLVGFGLLGVMVLGAVGYLLTKDDDKPKEVVKGNPVAPPPVLNGPQPRPPINVPDLDAGKLTPSPVDQKPNTSIPPAATDPYDTDWRNSEISEEKRRALGGSAREAAEKLKKDGVKIEEIYNGYTVGLNKSHFTAEGTFQTAVLSQLRLLGVTELSWGDFPVSNAGFLQLDKLRCIRKISPGSSTITDADFEGMKSIICLKQIDVRGSSGKGNLAITGTGFQHLSGCTALNWLGIEQGSVNDTGLVEISRLTGLEYLFLENNRVTDSGIAHLAKLSKLGSLDLRENPVNGSGFKNSGFKSLSTLRLRGSSVDDAGVESIAKLSGLKELELDDTKITGASIKSLASLSNLEELSIRGIVFKDGELEPLLRCPKLKTVSLSKNKVTPDAIEKLKKSNPNLKVSVYSD